VSIIVNYANRGKSLEYITEWACRYYRNNNIAIINKIPTPFKILGRLQKYYYGHYEKKSTVDFEGILKTRQHIAFDCKMVKGDLFHLSNIKPHQVEYLKQVNEFKGISFVLIEFVDYNVYIRLPFEVLEYYINNISTKRGSKSINIKNLIQLELRHNNGVTVDFLQGYY